MIKRLLILLSFLISGITLNGDWGRIHIFEDGRGYPNVILENSKIKVIFERDPRSWGGWIGFNPYCIKTLILKEAGNYNIAGGRESRIDDGMGKSAIGTAVIVHDGQDKKTVRLEYDPDETPCAQNPNSKTTWCNDNIQEVTIYPDLPFIRIEYINYNLFVVDYADWPDGWNLKRKVVYGEEHWPRTVNPNDPKGRPFSQGEENVFFTGNPRDGGALNYHGMLIFGEYLVDDGKGYGRVIPPEFCSIVKFWENGWEIFLRGKNPISYLMGVTGGAEEILSLGQTIVDEFTGEKSTPNPGSQEGSELTTR